LHSLQDGKKAKCLTFKSSVESKKSQSDLSDRRWSKRKCPEDGPALILHEGKEIGGIRSTQKWRANASTECGKGELFQGGPSTSSNPLGEAFDLA